MDRTGVRQDGLGGRRRFLRWSNLTTWRNYASAGLVHDTTVGYAEGVGFRAEHAATIPRSTSPVRVSSTSWNDPSM